MSTTPEQVVFAHSVEGQFARALGGEVPPALQEQTCGLGIDLTKKLLAAGLTFASARELSVEVAEFTEAEVVYRITWS